jgi:hypothetical protein
MDRLETGEKEARRVHKPWLLEGAAGSALALLGVIQTDLGDWDAAFLIG